MTSDQFTARADNHDFRNVNELIEFYAEIAETAVSTLARETYAGILHDVELIAGEAREFLVLDLERLAREYVEVAVSPTTGRAAPLYTVAAKDVRGLLYNLGR